MQDSLEHDEASTQILPRIDLLPTMSDRFGCSVHCYLLSPESPKAWWVSDLELAEHDLGVYVGWVVSHLNVVQSAGVQCSLHPYVSSASPTFAVAGLPQG